MMDDRRDWMAFLLPAGLLCIVGALLLVGWWLDLLGPLPVRTIYLVVLTAAANALAFVALLAIAERLTWRRRERRRCQRELGYFLTVGGREGSTRVQGLVRELNELGATPRSLAGALLPGIDLSGADLTGTSLRGAQLPEANLHGAELAGAELFGCDLTGAMLSLANLQGANLRSSNLTGAKLVKARLTGADLQRAVLVDANVDGVELAQVSLELAQFARPDGDEIPQSLHPSVEDWVRERLDPEGRFRTPISSREMPE